MNAKTGIVSASALFTTLMTITTVTFFVALAHGQSADSQSSISAPAAENTMTTSTSELKTENQGPQSPWKGGVLFVYDHAGRVKTATEDNTSSNFQTETHFRLKYQPTEHDSFSLVQRLFYYKAVLESSQNRPFLGNLRLEYNRTGNLLGGDASLITRATLPTGLEGRRDAHFLGMATLIPEVYWNLTPKLQLGYSGYMGTEFYDDTAQLQGAAATAVTFINSGAANYMFSDKVTLSQSAGIQEYDANTHLQLNHPQRLSQTIELATTLSYNATKNLNVSVAAMQSAPTMPDSINPANGKILAYEKSFTLFSRDQTMYEFTGSVNF